MMAALQWLFILLTTLSSVYSQDLTLSGARVIILNNGNNDPYPVRFYTGFQRNADASTTPRGNLPNLDECLRACVNANGAVLPTATPACNAVDFITGVTAPTDNCFTHLDTGCSVASAAYTANAASTHYKVVHLCDDTRVLQVLGTVTIDTTNLPNGVTVNTVATQTNPADCAVLCNVRPSCIAADFSAVGCRHFDTTNTQTFGPCLPTISTVGGTAYVVPCNTAQFGGIKAGLVDGAVPRTATADSFFQCGNLCDSDPECVGFQYNTVAEFLLPLATRCALYGKYAVAVSIGCQDAVVSRNMFTVVKVNCQFNAFPNMRKVGGIPQPQWRTLYECERECHYNVMCTGFDWNKAASTRDRDRCWFHTEYRGGCEDLRASTDVDHYDLIASRCSVNADDYSIFLGVQASGTAGTTQTTATTYALCLAACNANATCQGFDFITTTTTCITHTDASVCNSFTSNAGATHYRKWSYDCYWRFKNAKRSGGVAQMGVNILGNCERICRQTVGCEGFDFDRTGRVPGTPCFLHLTGTVCNPLVRAADIEHYRVRTRVCPDELNVIATANWGNAMQNVHTIGNRRNGVEQSAIECLQTCVRLGNRECAGVDYDRRTGYCYIVSRDNACQATAAVLTFLDRIQLPTGCDAPAVAGYTGSGSQHRVGGELRDTSSSPTDCATICSGDPLCLSFDFDRTNNECWTHSQTQECRNVMPTFNNNCCDHYVNSTFSCTNYSPPTFSSYTNRNLMHVRGGLPASAQLNLVTERQCIMHCEGRADCFAVDFNFGRNECYVHTDRVNCQERGHTLVHRYIKAGNCGV